MRASATSRSASPASVQASQAKANSAPEDKASPFAIMVDRIAPKDGVKDAKSSQKDNARDAHDRSDDKSAVDTGSQQDANTTRSASQPSAKTTPSAKAEKSRDDKQNVPTETDETAPDESQIAATTLQLLSLQNSPPPPPVQPSGQLSGQLPGQLSNQSPVANPSTDSSGDLTVGAAAAAAPTPPPADFQPGASSADVPAPQPKSAQDDQQTDETPVAAGSQAQAPQSPPPQPDFQTAGETLTAPAAAKPAANPAPQSTGDDKATQEITTAAANAPKADTAPKAVTRKSDTVKAAPPKADKTDIAKSRFDSKTAPHKDDADKLAQLTSALPAEADEISDIPAPKPAPLPVSLTTNSNPAIDTITPAQPANLAAAPQITQQIQVTATPAPNLPALAVEISAKSQSGAKQFDIRLDPPELGRVEVRLSIDATGKTSAHLSADQPQTLSLLQKDAPVLVRALRDAGLDVSQDGLNFSLRQQSDNNQNGSAGNSNRRSRSFALSATTGIDATAMTAAYRGPANGRLDIRV